MSESKTPQSRTESGAVVDEADLYLAFRLMKAKDLDGAEERIGIGLEKARQNKNASSEGLYLSALGVLYKLKGDYKKSYKHYQQAEQLLPEDNSLKIITATLLIHEFAQHDTAIRKLKKVLGTSPDASVTHCALALLAMAYFATGKKDLARETLAVLVADDFSCLKTAANVNYNLPEIFLKKNFETELCRQYLHKALSLADQNREEGYKLVISKLLELI